jgi:cytochrome c biogenesis protein CcdA
MTHGLAVGLAVSAGFAAVFVTSGLVVSAGLRSLVRIVPWAAVVIGAVLVLVGVAMLAGGHIGIRVVGERFRPGSERSYRRVFVFGAAYATASLSCTLAVLLAVVAQALATRNPAQMVAVFGAYAAGAATLLVTLSVSAALAKAAFARAVGRLLPVAGRMAGGVLVLSGIYLVAYWLPALNGGTGQSAVSIGENLSTRYTIFLNDHQTQLVVVAVGLTAASLAATGWRWWRHTKHDSAGDQSGRTDPGCADRSAIEPSFESEDAAR